MHTMMLDALYLEDGLDKLGLSRLDDAGRDDGGLVTEGRAGNGGQGLNVVSDSDLSQGTGTIISLSSDIHGLSVINNLGWGRGCNITHHNSIVWTRDKVGLEWDEGS